MKRIIFENAYLASGWSKNVLIELDDKGKITAITPKYKGDGQSVSGYALPGINNIHSHAFQRAMAGLAEYSTSATDSFWTWRDIMYKFAEKISADDLKAIAAQLYLEMLKAGYVSVSEFHYLHNAPDGAMDMSRAIMAAANDAGLGLCHLPVLYMASGFGGKPLNDKQKQFGHSTDEYLKLLETLKPKNENQHLGICFHSLRAVPEDALKEVLKNNPTNGPIHIHIAEQMAEVNDSIAFSGKRPVEWLYDQADVDDRWCLIHATHLTDDEVSMMAKSGAIAGICPTTEANLGDGLFPLKSYLDQGGKIAIGSDSHISVSVTEELRLLEYGQRLASLGRNVAVSETQKHTGTNLYQLSLQGGAQASKFNNGAIEVGKRADIVVLDDKSPLLMGSPKNSIIDRYIFNGNQNMVKDVFVMGKHVIQDYHHTKEQEILNDFKKTVERLKKHLD
ncbi:MAG: formimidoylglutamate deiminase [Emcibacteraceae bacterium]|nr:formimidoylglutamate deiminase [Emcibacteraceae bacterium]